jgi:hypothetical protein
VTLLERRAIVPGNASFEDSAVVRVLLKPFKLAFAATLGLAGLLLVAWSVQWLHVEHVWPGRVEGLRTLLTAELAAGAELAALQGTAAWPVSYSANGLYALVFKVTGLHDMGQRFADGSSLSIPDTVLRRTWVARQEEIEIAMLSTRLVGLRAGILIRFPPLLILLYAIGATDGVSQRAIRQAQAGRESASLYHRAKYAQVVVLVTSVVGVLMWPAPVSWEFCWLLVAVVIGVLAAGQWAFYKKHV